MNRDEFGLKPPHCSYVDMIEHMSDGVVVDMVNRDATADTKQPDRPAPSGRENSRPSSRSSRGERD